MPEGMEVQDAALIVGDRDARRAQIEAQHLCRSPALLEREEWLPWPVLTERIAQRLCKLLLERQHIVPPSLAALRWDRHRRCAALQVQAGTLEATDLACAEPGLDGKPVEQRSRLAGQPLVLWAMTGRVEQPTQLLSAERPPFASSVHLGVERLERAQRVLGEQLARDGPLAELLHCAQVMVRGLDAKPAFARAKVLERLLHSVRPHVAQHPCPDRLEDDTRVAHDLANVLVACQALHDRA